MTHTNTIASVADIASDLVQRGLARYCSVCKARPGKPCTNKVKPGELLPGRAIHLERATKPDGHKESDDREDDE